LFDVPAQILENLLLTLLYLKEDRLSEEPLIVRRMNLTCLQEDLAEVGHALLSK